MPDVKIAIGEDCKAFDTLIYGNEKVKQGPHVSAQLERFNKGEISFDDLPDFAKMILEGIENYDKSKSSYPDMLFITLPRNSTEYVLAGVGRHVADTEAYVIVPRGGGCRAMLKPTRSAKVTRVEIEVRTKDEHFNGWCSAKDEDRIRAMNVTHVLVDVVAYLDCEERLASPYVFLRNLIKAHSKSTVGSFKDDINRILKFDDEWCEVYHE